MPDFDPYHKWLGISPQHQPPNHYRLLSLDLYEADLDVIEAAVDRIAAFLQDVAGGPHVKESQKLLNEIAAARLCLLDATQKRAYDQKLRSEIAQAIGPPNGKTDPTRPPPVAPAFEIDTGSDRVAKPPPVRKTTTKRPALTVISNRGNASSPGKTTKRDNPKPSPLLVLSFTSGGGLLLFAIALALFAGGDSEAKRRAAEEAKVRERLDSFAEMGRQAESIIPDFQPQFDYTPPAPAKKPKKKRTKK